ALGARLDRLMEMADLAVDDNFPVRRWKIPGDQLDQSGLAGTIVAHQPHDLAGLDRQTDVVYRVDSTETLRYVTNVKQRHSSTSLSCSSSGCFLFDLSHHNLGFPIAAAMIAAPTLPPATSAIWTIEPRYR